MSEVRLRVGAIDGERHYAAPSVPMTLLRSLIGAPATDDVYASCVVAADTDWRDIPITIKWGKRRFRYTVRRGLAR